MYHRHYKYIRYDLFDIAGLLLLHSSDQRTMQGSSLIINKRSEKKNCTGESVSMSRNVTWMVCNKSTQKIAKEYHELQRYNVHVCGAYIIGAIHTSDILEIAS